jgi:asparagine synthase (glutamine-hydrolysing)
MSAIAAIIDWDGSEPEPDRRAGLEAALGVWRSDSVRTECTPGAALGIALLAADAVRRRGRQPHVDASRNVVLVADCRLDERGALLRELELAADASDGDLIAAAYQRWGEEVARHLQGDFACVLWDSGRRRCVAFRDHLGVRPLFYCNTARGMAFASDVEMLLRLARPRPLPDDRAVVEHLLWEYVSTDRTFWNEISRLPAGHCLVDGASGGRRVWRYWNPDVATTRFTSMADAQHEFQRAFVQSVDRRFDSTGPVLAHLSGGVDSSSIVCIAERVRRESPSRPALTAVSQRFPGQSWDEGAFIAAVREATGVDAIDWDGSQAEFLDLIAPSLGGPGTRASRTSGSAGDLEIANRRSSRVILSGEGGDQLGAPWGLIEDLAAARPIHFAIETVRRGDLALRFKVARARQLLRLLIPVDLRREVAVLRYRRRLPAWLAPRWRDLAAELLPASRPNPSEPAFQYQVQRVHWRHLTSGRLATALELQQVVAGRRGVEIRFPFLDRDLVELVLSLAPEHWPQRGSRIRLQRDALASVLPAAVRFRTSKTNFSGAGRQLVKRSARELDALLRDGQWLSGRYVIRQEAEALFRRTLHTEEPNESDWLEVRAIATLETWLRALFRYAPSRHA